MLSISDKNNTMYSLFLHPHYTLVHRNNGSNKSFRSHPVPSPSLVDFNATLDLLSHWGYASNNSIKFTTPSYLHGADTTSELN